MNYIAQQSVIPDGEGICKYQGLWLKSIPSRVDKKELRNPHYTYTQRYENIYYPSFFHSVCSIFECPISPVLIIIHFLEIL